MNRTSHLVRSTNASEMLTTECMVTKYNAQETWAWNLKNGPRNSAGPSSETPVAGSWAWCGIPIGSPLGISAGPLLNSQWLLHYANLGFDVLVYKTVRSCSRDCYPLPNLIPVHSDPLSAAGSIVSETEQMDGTWAVSFGMPSQPPDIWRADVEVARQRLPAGKVLVVSVVGTQDESISGSQQALQQLAADFAQCARWAVESGAHGIEANFSCPNVATPDGQLYQQADAAAVVAERIRSEIGNTPLVLKIGRISSEKQAADLIAAVGPWIHGLAMTNSIAARVKRTDGSLAFGGESRGICGAATLAASTAQLKMFRQALERENTALDLVGVGGIADVTHVRDYLKAGADSVAMATAAMTDPEIGRKIRRAL